VSDVQPHNLEAEKAVLGAVLINADAFEHAELEPVEFYRSAHQVLWKAYGDLRRTEWPIDLVTLVDALGPERLDLVGGVVYIASLVDGVPRSVNVAHYAAIVRQHHVRRQLRGAAERLLARASDPEADVADVLTQAEGDLYGVRIARRTDFLPLGETLRTETAPLIAELLSGRPAFGLPTGFVDLDRTTRGLHAGQLTLLAARPGIGKSALALQIAGNVAARRSGVVAFVSLEMSRGELALRLLTTTGLINAQRLHNGTLHLDERDRVMDALTELESLPLEIDDGMELSIPVLRSKLRRLALAERGLSLVVVDYLQLMQTPAKAETRQLALAEVSRGLKALTKELAVPVLALSQLNRDVEKRGGSGRPRLSDLRESGSLEQDADNVWLLHREDEEAKPETAGQAEVILAKQRNGPTGSVRLRWDRSMTRFDSIGGGR
jgi:replicative DNA helicase